MTTAATKLCALLAGLGYDDSFANYSVKTLLELGKNHRLPDKVQPKTPEYTKSTRISRKLRKDMKAEIAKSGLRFLYIRDVDNYGHYRRTGGGTVAYSVAEGKLSFALAKCRKSAHFDKTVGRFVALHEYNLGIVQSVLLDSHTSPVQFLTRTLHGYTYGGDYFKLSNSMARVRAKIPTTTPRGKDLAIFSHSKERPGS